MPLFQSDNSIIALNQREILHWPGLLRIFQNFFFEIVTMHILLILKERLKYERRSPRKRNEYRTKEIVDDHRWNRVE